MVSVVSSLAGRARLFYWCCIQFDDCSITGAGRVIATDGDDGSVQLTSTNISLNCKEENIEALKLRWYVLCAAWACGIISHRGDQNHVQNVREAILRFNSAHGSKRNKPDFIVASDVSSLLNATVM